MHRTKVTTMIAVLALAASAAVAATDLLLYQSFDAALDRVDYAAAPVKVAVAPAVQSLPSGAYGNAAGFPAGAGDATVRWGFAQPAPATGWTIGLFNRLGDKEVLTAPDKPYLCVLDQDGKPLLQVDVSGLVKILDTDGRALAAMECFDALYWIGGENIHLAFAYDADGAAAGAPRAKLTAYWAARPYGCAGVDLGARRPAALVAGGSDVNGAMDELTVFSGALPPRAIYALSRPPRMDAAALRQRIPEIVAAEAARPDAVRRAAWHALTRTGLVFEAEAGQATNAAVSGRNAVSASGQAYLKGGTAAVKIALRADKAGEYAISLRYALDRHIDLLWPVRHPEAKTAWSHNAAVVSVRINGQDLGAVRLYPTGSYNGHTGDVEPWSWMTLAPKVALPAGDSVLELSKQDGLGQPLLDAVLLSAAPGPPPPYPRWVDGYRVPPAWWVAGQKTENRGGKRRDTYTVLLCNRTDEPYACAIELEDDMLGEGQTATTATRHIALAPFEEKSFEIVFETPADKAGSSGYLRVLLWNEDVALVQEYRLWNYLPQADFARQSHPALVPAPDPALQAQFRAWLTTRDEAKLTPELRKWAAGPDLTRAAPEFKALERGAKVKLEMFEKPLLGEQLAMLDLWMGLSAADLRRYLPRAYAQNSGYGNTWDKVANELTGTWLGQVFDVRTEPDIGEVWRPGGDIDLVTVLHAKGYDHEALKKRKEKIEKSGTWQRDGKDADVFSALRMVRWGAVLGVHHGDGPAVYPRRAGLPILAEAYYLTGDERYARKAIELAETVARIYTGRPKMFFGDLHREDRDWWGSRAGGPYQMEYGRGMWQLLGVRLLDLLWPALSAADRDMLIHNYCRWGMYDACNGPLWDDPDKDAKCNREDMAPFIAFARVVGDAAPYRGLGDYLRLLNNMVLDDGVHICSIGSYGGVSAYIAFMQKLTALGVDAAKGNAGLRNAFLGQTRFAFSCGSVQPMDDGGGGQGLMGLGPRFGMPSAEQYAWGYELYRDDMLKSVPLFLDALTRATGGAPAERAAKMRAFYAPGPAGEPAGASAFPMRAIWPDVHVAETKGLAMLRNRSAGDPRDWIEIVFDYGKFGGRAHGHPTKLSILTAYNGQVGSQDYGDLTRNAPEANNNWFKGGYSHNTVQVDYRGHRGAGGAVQIGNLIAAGGDATLPWIDADSARMFNGVYMRRTVFVTAAGIVDLYLCRSDVEHVYDWPYHNFGIARTETPLAPVDIAPQGLLRFTRAARAAPVDGLIQVTWQDAPLSVPPRRAKAAAAESPRKGSTSMIDEEVFARLWALPQAGTELLLFAGPTVTSINAEKEIDYAMLRRKTNSTVFAAVIEPWRAATGPKIKAVEKLPVRSDGRTATDTEAYAVKVMHGDGKTQIFLANYSGGVKTVGKVATGASSAAWTLGEDGGAVDLRDSSQALFKSSR